MSRIKRDLQEGAAGKRELMKRDRPWREHG